jgi:hypothetical protein
MGHAELLDEVQLARERHRPAQRGDAGVHVAEAHRGDP